MSPRVLILSDLHLGRPRLAAIGAAALRPLWAGADHVVVNGDVAEVHHPRHWPVAARETMHLFDLCERDGVDLTLLSGNHDPFITDLRHLHLADGRVFVTHGDVLHPAVAPWSPAAARIRDAHERALAAIEPEIRHRLESRLSAAQQACYAEWSDQLALEARQSSVLAMIVRPWTLVQVLRYWRLFPGLAARFVAEHAPRARFVVVGHTHRPGVWRRDGRVVVNTGSFGFPGRPRAVLVADGLLTVWPIVREGAAYRLGAAPLARFALEPGTATDTAVTVARRSCA